MSVCLWSVLVWPGLAWPGLVLVLVLVLVMYWSCLVLVIETGHVEVWLRLIEAIIAEISRGQTVHHRANSMSTAVLTLCFMYNG